MARYKGGKRGKKRWVINSKSGKPHMTVKRTDKTLTKKRLQKRKSALKGNRYTCVLETSYRANHL